MIKKLKMILPILFLTLLFMPGTTSNAAPDTVTESIIAFTSSNSNETVMPMSDDIRWVYFTATNGKKYKRLFNYSTNEWIGDWIPVP